MSQQENIPFDNISIAKIRSNLRHASIVINELNASAGWWTNLATGESMITGPGQTPKRNVPEMLMLIVTEVSEAMEGYRKGCKDDHLPHRDMMEVELADALIRILDMAGGIGLDIGGAVAEKLKYNLDRADHKIENRLKDGGKKA